MTRRSSRRYRPAPLPSPTFAKPGSHQDWELVIAGDLSDKQTDLIEKLVELPRKSRGVIYFDSCGGGAYVGLALASLIKLRGLEVTGVVVGECSSAALMPFAACDKRLVPEHATLLFHPLRWQSEEDVRIEEAAEWARHFRVLEEDLDQLLVKMFPIDNELLQRWTRPGRFITGTEMIEAGLAKKLDLFAGTIWEQSKPIT